MKDQNRPWVLGIGASHNGAVCLLRGDEIVVAVQEERLMRAKRARHPAQYASQAIAYCLDYADIAADDLSAIGVCTLEAANSIVDDVHLNPQLRPDAHEIPVTTITHHLGHAIGAFATSGFSSASVLIADGNGSPWSTLSSEELNAVVPAQRERWSLSHPFVSEIISLYRASGTSVTPIEKHVAAAEIRRQTGMRPFLSLGHLFEQIGAQVFGDPLDGPGKVMGLAPYGRPTTPVSEFFDIVGDEIVFRTDVPQRFQHRDRWPKHQQVYTDLAASVQLALEHALLWVAGRLRKQNASPRLCYAGGVALNSVANERLVREAGFDDVFIMPAAEDSGIAIGAAYAALWRSTSTRTARRLAHDNVGRRYASADVSEALERHPLLRARHEDAVIERAADLLADGKIIGWFQGGAELGPRALGQRSILADPRREDMKDRLNAHVKFREAFRPYAPAVLREHVEEWFDCGGLSESPFMLRVLPVRSEQRHRIPAVVHVDGTGRVQTVTAAATPRLHALLRAFHERTGVPVLLNTSLNIAGDPIVETPHEALCVLEFTALDACVIEEQIATKPPGWSLLDCAPQLANDWLSVEHCIRGGQLRGLRPTGLRGIVSALESQSDRFGTWADKYGKDHLRIVVNGRYGRVVHAFAPELLPVLRAMNGRRSGWAILDQLNRRPPGYTEAALLALLRRFASFGIVTLRQPIPSRGRSSQHQPALTVA